MTNFFTLCDFRFSQNLNFIFCEKIVGVSSVHLDIHLTYGSYPRFALIFSHFSHTLTKNVDFYQRNNSLFLTQLIVQIHHQFCEKEKALASLGRLCSCVAKQQILAERHETFLVIKKKRCHFRFTQSDFYYISRKFLLCDSIFEQIDPKLELA